MSDSIASPPTTIDLSHATNHGLVTHEGLPASIIRDYMSREESGKHYAPRTEFQIGMIAMVANTGTYLDSPFHRLCRWERLVTNKAESSRKPCRHQDFCEGRPAIEKPDFPDGEDLAGKAVLVETAGLGIGTWHDIFVSHVFHDRDFTFKESTVNPTSAAPDATRNLAAASVRRGRLSG